MSCFNSNCYLPQPPRAWSRVQNSCSVITDTDNNGLVRDPYTGQLVPAVVLAERIAILNKGNVLQYKANSSSLTKAQKYSKIAKGQWVNRNTTWATQSTRGYTNPNTTSLKRDGNINIAIDPITGAIIGPTGAPPTCLKPIIQDNEGLPSNGGGGSSIDEPDLPPPVVPTPGSDVFPDIIPDTPVEPIVIQDGGNLICSVQENICTGETKRSLSQQLCHPTTDSDVPGPIQDLCWNDGTQTWYPRQRYVMTNSSNKWPVNAELFSSIIINPPVITSISSDRNVVTLIWTFNSSCLPATNFNIYQDGILVKTVPSNIFTTTITTVDNCTTYEYYIKAENITAKATSDASNIVSIYVAYIEPPSKLSYTTTGSGTIQLKWNLPNPNCQPAVSYNIYKDGLFIHNTLSLIYIVTGLTNCDLYTFSVSSLDIYGNKSSFVSLDVIPLWPDPPKEGDYYNVSSGSICLTWKSSDSICQPDNKYKIYDNSGLYIGTTTNLYWQINGLTNCLTYTYNITSVDNVGHESTYLAINVQPEWPQPPTSIINSSYTLKSITGLNTGTATFILTWTDTNTCVLSDKYNIYINSLIFTTTSTSTIIGPLTIGITYPFTITSFATVKTSSGMTQVESNPSSSSVNLPVIYTVSGTPTITYDNTNSSIMLKYLNDGTFNFNYDLSMEYTLVGGGGGGGFYSSSTAGTAAGGGGHVLNTDSPRLVSKNNFTLTVGDGGLGGISFSDGNGKIGTDSLIQGNSFIISTTNSVYSGQGGRGLIDASYEGGGGPGNSSSPQTSATGGTYDTNYGNGTGGAGGTLTLVDSTNNIITPITLGDNGQDSQLNSGGNGGNGNKGIDGIYYGGGGGGGANPFPQTVVGGTGGLGGGGNGAYNNIPFGTAAENGQSNTGGGGGGGCNNINPGLVPGNGADGIIIIKFTSPP
jgi:hypothetical protein